jgi:hypothetical protein
MPGRHDVAVAMADAGARLLDALDDEQRTIARWPFPSDEERRLWFYTPTDHGGLPLARMDAPQQRLAFQLMSTGLSTAGYVTASTIIGLENVLDLIEGFRASWSRPAGAIRCTSFECSAARAGWHMGLAHRRHHVSINFTIVDGQSPVRHHCSSAPTRRAHRSSAPSAPPPRASRIWHVSSCGPSIGQLARAESSPRRRPTSSAATDEPARW